MITAVLPIVFTSSFDIKMPNQTFEGFMYKVERRKKGLPFVRAPKTCIIARHRNYRLVLSLRSRYRQKRKTAYRRKITAIPVFCFYHEKPPTAKQFPPYGITDKNSDFFPLLPVEQTTCGIGHRVKCFFPGWQPTRWMWETTSALACFPLTGGCSEGLGAFCFFFKHHTP